MKDMIRNWNYDFFSGFCNFIFDNYYDVCVEGLENIINDKEGGIIVSNHDTPGNDWKYEKGKDGKFKLHTHSVDQLLIAAYLDPKQRFHAIVSKNHYKNPLRGGLLNALQQIPATKYGILDPAGRYLEKKEYILIFPEGNSGQKSKIINGGKTKIYPGLGRLISNLDNPKIFPTYVKINGKRDSLWPKFKNAKVKFGKPFHYLDLFGEFPLGKNNAIDSYKISENIMNEKIYSLR